MAAHTDIVDRLAGAFNSGDLERFVDLFDDHVVWYPAPDHPEPGPVHGRDGVRGFVDEWLTPWEYYEVHTVDVVDRGDKLIWATRHTGKSSTVDMDDLMWAVLTLDAGRVVEIRWFWNEHEARELFPL